MAGVTGDSSVSEITEQGEHLSVANTKFAFDLYQRQAAVLVTDQNIFMSPLSISVALAMTYLGARGQTESQMKDVLHFSDMEDDHLHQAFTNIMSVLNQPNQSYKLYMANRLFGDSSYTFLNELLAAGRKYYAAELAPVDFRGDSNGAAAIINNWVADNTNNKITEIVPANAVNSLTRLILVNAVYFKGDWVKKFNVNLTTDADFYMSPNESVKVKMMHMSKGKFYYGVSSELHCQAIELPYSGTALSMFILLPDLTETSLSEVERKLTFDDLMNVKEKFEMFSLKVNVWLPRFNLDEKLSLNEMLVGMGMKDLFTEGVADLSGMDGSRELYVSKVLHRAVVEVNEEGTEAAAATAVVMMMRSAVFMEEFNFRADHPFLFFIQHRASKSVLFLGRVFKPNSAMSNKEEL